MRNHWRITAIISTSAVIIIFLFGNTALSIIRTWNHSTTFSHGFLILPISVYLIWKRRHQLTLLPHTPNFMGYPFLAIIGFFWLLGKITNILVIQQISLVIMLQALVWTVLGTEVTRVLQFPLAFLFFAVPVGEVLIPPLQDFTALFAVKTLQLSGIPAYLEGRFITISSGTWEVAKACSGLNFLIPSTALGFLYAFLTYRQRKRRLVFVLASVSVPIVANGIRAYGVIMLAHFSNYTIALNHLMYGWLFYSVIMILMFGVGLRWRESGDIKRLPELTTFTAKAIDCSNSSRTLMLAAAGGVALLALAPVTLHLMEMRGENPGVIQAIAPSVKPPWGSRIEYPGDWKPRFIGADAEVTQSYGNGDHQVHLYFACYAREKQGAELISSENVLIDGKQWVRLAEGEISILVDGQPLSVKETEIRSRNGTRRIIWSWYWVDRRFLANPYLVKLFQAKAWASGDMRFSAAIALSTNYNSHREEAVSTLQSFLHHTSIQAALNNMRK